MEGGLLDRRLGLEWIADGLVGGWRAALLMW